MAPSRAAFRRRFLAWSPAERIAFLADLYEAQGWQVTRQESGLDVRRSAGGSTRRVRLVDEAVLPETDADVAVVTAETPTVEVDGVTVVDTAELYDRLRYGVGREASERLVATYVGDLDGPEPGTHDETADGDSPADDGASPADGRSLLSDRTRRGLLLAMGAAIGGAATLGATWLERRPSPIRAPGVTHEGITEPGTLATAHMSAIQAPSYTLELDYVSRDDDLGIRSSYALDLALTAERAFFAVVSTDGADAPKVLGEPPSQSYFFSDGQQHYVNHAPDRDEGAVAFDPPEGFVGTWNYWAYLFAFGGEIGSTPEVFFRTVFEAVPTRVVDVHPDAEGDVYRLRSSEPTLTAPASELTGQDVRDVDLRALVDDRGLVRECRLEYRSTLDGTTHRVSRRVRYTKVDETDVQRPDWAT